MEKRTKRWGDRPDAYWIRDLDGLHAIMPHLMNKRTDAEVYVNMEFDVTETLRYIEEKNRGEDEYKTTLFHCILMAVAKTVYLRPDLNRYISGRRYYQRHEITLGFVAKKRFEDHSEEKLVVATAPEDWTLTAVTRQVRDVVELGITLDERVADGFYFGRSLKIVQHLMSHPELLDRPLKEAIDLDC